MGSAEEGVKSIPYQLQRLFLQLQVTFYFFCLCIVVWYRNRCSYMGWRSLYGLHI